MNYEDRGGHGRLKNKSVPFFGWHFRWLPSVEKDLWDDLKTCSKNRFERHMHQGQDYFSHYRWGYRVVSFYDLQIDFGHARDGEKPDHFIQDWRDANKWTKSWVNAWQDKCACGVN